jgi:nicotinate-nucleotide adenylyltransferase
MKTGLFFGSFNPVHNGHMSVAKYFIENSDILQLWFVISPHNPLKNKESLLPGHLRLKMLELAINNDLRFKICDIEFQMPQPSFTIDTLRLLSEKYQDTELVILMGSDGLIDFDKWKDSEKISNKYQRYIYPRAATPDFDNTINKNCIFFKNAPYLDISSSSIRQALKEGKDASQYLPEKVFQFIQKQLQEGIIEPI